VIEELPKEGAHLFVMRDRDGYWLWWRGAYRPLILTRGKQPRGEIRHGLRVLAGIQKFTFQVGPRLRHPRRFR